MHKFYHLILIFLLICPLSWAYSPESLPNPMPVVGSFVCNPDGILTPAEAQQIDYLCHQLRKQTEVELAVIAIENADGWEAADFAQAVFNRWGIGTKERNTGAMILLITGSRDIRIHTGGGLEGLLPDALCEQIIDEQMIDPLRAQQWGNALLAGAATINALLTREEVQAELLLGFVPATSDTSDFICGYLILALALLILLAILLYRDMRPRAYETDQQRMRRQSSIWQMLFICAIIFPLPIAMLTRWFYKHGGREIKAMLDEDARRRAAAAAEAARRSNSGFNGGGFYGGGFGGSGRGGGFSGGSFGGGMSFGGGAGRKF